MNILINDLNQFSDIDDDLKSPSLADRVPNTGAIIVKYTIPSEYAQFDVIPGVLSQPYYSGISGVLSQPFSSNISGVLSQPLSVLGSNKFNCIGIGGTDATQIIINGSIIITSEDGNAFANGLYKIPETVQASTVTFEHNGSYMGRIAVGQCIKLCPSPSREPGFYTNQQPRTTLSGQVIASAGGYAGQVVGVDFRYKVIRDIYEEFRRAYATQTSKGYPFFMDFDNDKWFPVDKFYGRTDNNLLFQSSINRFNYSRRFEFRQAF